MFEIYAYWNAASIKAALDGVAMIMGGNDFVGLMKTIALLGLLSAAAMGFLKLSFKEPGVYLLILLLVYGTLFVPKVTVSIRDLRSGAVYSVANVPLGVAFLSATTSKIGKYLTEAFETSFAAADELKFSNTGMAWGANAMKSMANLSPKKPKTVEAWANFTKSCVVPEVVDSTDKYNSLVNSDKVMDLLESGRGTATGFLNPARIARMPLRSGLGYSNFPCIGPGGTATAFDEAKAWLVDEEDAQKGWLGKILMPDNHINPTTLIVTYLPGAEGVLLGTSRTISEQIMQSLAVNLLNASAGNMGLASGDAGAVALQIGTITAQKSAENSYRVMGMIGAEILPKMRNIVEIMLIAVFPIVMIMIILAGEQAGAVLKTYAMTSVWVQLWAPLYAVVNHMLTPLTASRLQAATGGSIAQTMENTYSIIQTGFSEQAMAGALVMAVPVIAYALVRGGEVAMSSAAGALTGPASGAATSKGGEAGVGNVNVGNTSWGTHSSNNVSSGKWDTNGSVSSGAFTTSSGLTTQRFDTGTGGGAMDASAGVSNLGEYSVDAKGAVSAAATQGYNQAWGDTQTKMAAFSKSAQAAYTNYAKTATSSGTSTSVKSSSGFGQESSDGVAASRARAAMTSLAQRTGLSEGEAFSMTMAASAGTPGGGDKSAFMAGFGGRLEAAGKVSKEQAWDMAKQASQSADFKQLTQAVDKASKGTTAERSATGGTTNESGRDASLTQARQSLEQASQSATKAQQYQQAVQTASTMDASASEKLNNKVQDRLGGQQRASELINTARNGAPGQREAAQQEIRSAIASVVNEELESRMGGNYGPNSSGGGAPALSGGAGAAADQLKRHVDGQTAKVPSMAEGGDDAVRRFNEQTRSKIPAPTSQGKLRVDGQSADDVDNVALQRIGNDKNTISTTGKAVDGAATELENGKKTETSELSSPVKLAGSAVGQQGVSLGSSVVGVLGKVLGSDEGMNDDSIYVNPNPPKQPFSGAGAGWKDLGPKN